MTLLALLASGCAGAAPLTVRHEFSRCPRPVVEPIAELRTGERLGSPANLEAVMAGFDAAATAVERQAGALGCYEIQSSGEK